MLRIYKI